MPPPSVTLQDVADRAGVHRSTVSLALRNHARISPAVRERIQNIAREIGYRSNPLVTALMRSRRTQLAAKHVVLAYVTDYPTRYGWRPPHHDRPDYFPAAMARAEELGYKLEHFWLGEPGMTPERFAQILINRNISGLLIGRLPLGKNEILLPWEHFSSVALGLTLTKPNLHRVAEDAFASATEAMNQCLAKGYRRIGYVISEPNDSPNMADRWLGAYWRQQMHLLPEDRIPVCEYRPPAELPAHFLAWYDKHRPDVILTYRAEPIMDILTSSGRKLPDEAKLVLLVNDKPEHGFGGMYIDPGSVGALAVDMVVGMMHRGEIGLPAEPHHVLVPAKWVEAGVTATASTRSSSQAQPPDAVG
jgi:DNA-binding LacI/PurR family transcriptional regulator